MVQAISLTRHIAHAHCGRVLVVFTITLWIACVRHRQVAKSLCFPFFCLRSQVMSQSRSFQSARSSPPSLPPQPMPIDFTNTEHISDGLSDDPVLSEVDTFPPLSCFVCDGHFTPSGSLSRCVLQCCSLSIHLQCVTDLVHLLSQSVVCPACNSQSLSSLDFLHFQHLCCVRHAEAPAGECMICSSPQSFASSFSLPCCRQRIHYECLARSVHACGHHCLFCTQDLVPVLSDSLPAASFEHLDIPIDFNALLANSSLNSLCVSGGMPHPPPIFPLCCAHSCGRPDYEPLDDGRWEWFPISAQVSSSVWVLQKVCRSCGSSTSMQDIPALPQSRVLSVLALLLS